VSASTSVQELLRCRLCGRVADSFGEPQTRTDSSGKEQAVCTACAVGVDARGWVFVEQQQWRGATWRDPSRVAEREAAMEAERARVLADISKRDGWACVWCSLPLTATTDKTVPARATKEHLVPLSEGGPNKLPNITLACSSCNNKRGNLSLPQQYLLCLQEGLQPRTELLVAAATRLRLPELLSTICAANPDVSNR
jgi:hypothetical protein